MATAAPKAPEVTTKDLLKQHDEHVKARTDATTPGVKAAATKRIADIEQQLKERKAQFTPFVTPTKQPDVAVLTDAQLVQAHKAAIEQRQSDKSTAGIKAAAVIRIRKLEEQMTSRKVKFDAYTAPRGSNGSSGPAVESLTDAQLRSEYQSLGKQYADTQSAGIKASLTRRTRLVQAEASKRKLSLDSKPASKPASKQAAKK